MFRTGFRNYFFVSGDTDEGERIAYSVHIHYNPFTGIKKDVIKEGISVYPNPVNDLLFVTYIMNDASDVKFEIHDISGKLVKSFDEGKKISGSYREELDMTDVSSGTYIISCITQQGVYHTRFVKF